MIGVWFTSEAMSDVGEASIGAIKSVESRLNSLLRDTSDDCDLEIIVVFVIVPAGELDIFPEYTRYLKAKKTLDAKLHLHHQRILKGDSKTTEAAVVSALGRLPAIMKEKKICEHCSGVFRQAVSLIGLH